MKHILSILLVLTVSFSFAQRKTQTGKQQELRYEDYVYLPEIKTVEFYNRSRDLSMPVIVLGSGNELMLAFDDLRKGNHSLSYTIEHCDAEWKSSRLSTIEYLESFSEDRITNYRYSINTLQKFTHYELTLPNFSIKPKLAGNYLLKVFENGDQRNLVLTRRFYILTPMVNIQGEIAGSNMISERNKNQKINFIVSYQQLNILNPYLDAKVLVMQNGRQDKAQSNVRPSFVRPNQLVYNDLRSFDFSGGNEFRNFDLRSLRMQSERISRIYTDTVNTVVLLTDPALSGKSYATNFDNNGNFIVQNEDGRDNRTEADYSTVKLSLAAPLPAGEGNAYVIGKFNDYQLMESNRLIYNDIQKRFLGSMFVKQGLYDYHYVWADADGRVDDSIFDGSFFATDNSYQIFFYYRKPGGRWDELIGYTELNNSRSIRR